MPFCEMMKAQQSDERTAQARRSMHALSLSVRGFSPWKTSPPSGAYSQ
jgi:hypothetical protein